MSVKEVMTNLANAARARYSVSDTLTVSEITDLIYSENTDVAKLIDRTIDKIDVADGVTTIGENAFRGCSQLTTVTLPSSIESIGDNAFAECENLTNVLCDFYKDTVAGYPWGADVNVTSFEFTIPTPLTLTSEAANSTVQLNATGSPVISGLQYRTNVNSDFIPYTIGDTITLVNVGDYVQFRNTEDRLSYGSSNNVQFRLSGKVAATGSTQSMLNYRTTCRSSCFVGMFSGCTSLTTAPELPATTLADRCYYHMFSGCTSLTTAPELPATTLTESCYIYMFYECTSLTIAPELPATTLKTDCYNSMFYKCTSLTIAPELPATTLAEQCYRSMFEDCTSLTTAPELSATTLADRCYYHMFSGCTSLTTAPELPATTLTESCYYSMFSGCTSLITAPELPATTLVDGCYSRMFFNCQSLLNVTVAFTTWEGDSSTEGWLNSVSPSGTFTKPSQLPTQYGTSYIPEGWTVVNKD